MDLRTYLESQGLVQYLLILQHNGVHSLDALSTLAAQEKLGTVGIVNKDHAHLIALTVGAYASDNLSFSPIHDSPGGLRSAESDAEGRRVGGNHILLEVIAARAHGDHHLGGKEYYVKASVCSCDEEGVFVSKDHLRTGYAKGPFPTWINIEDALGDSAVSEKALKLHTNFEPSLLLALELKERVLIGENKLIGVVLFPISWFSRFKATTVASNWFPMRSDPSGDAEITAQLRLRLRVPGGAPTAVSRGLRVKSVNMSARKLSIVVCSAEISAGDFDVGALRVHVAVSLTAAGGRGVERLTATTKSTLEPTFNERFEFFSEIEQAKLLELRVHATSGCVKFSGSVSIPVQFFLAQSPAEPLEQWATILDAEKAPIGRLRFRMEVLPRAPHEMTADYSRTKSIAEERWLGSPPSEAPKASTEEAASPALGPADSIILERTASEVLRGVKLVDDIELSDSDEDVAIDPDTL